MILSLRKTVLMTLFSAVFSLGISSSYAAEASNNDDLVAPGLGENYGFGAIGFDMDTLVKRIGTDKVKNLRIGVSVNTQQNNWQLMWVDEFQRLSKKYGFKLSVLSADDDSVKQADDLKTLETQSVDGIIVFPHSTSAASGPVSALYGKIPVVSAIPILDVKVVSTINVKQTDKGAMIADKVAEDAKGENLNVLMLSHSDDIAILKDRIDGFTASAKKYPNIKIVAERVDKSDDGWLNVAKEALLANDNINTIVATYTRPMMGGYTAAKQLGRKDVRVYGVDADEGTLQLLEKGEIKGLHVQWPQAQAYTCLFQMLRVLNGDKVAPVFWESPNYAMSYARQTEAKKALDLLYPAKNKK